MSRYTCKYCGGDIFFTGEKIGTCGTCGLQVLFPQVNNEKIADMYNRANYLRQIHDYDAAISAYEHIVNENPFDPEARWNLVLCKYGIEYTFDKRTDTYVPGINRMNMDSILEDRDYLLAIENADQESAEIYKKDAQKIAVIQEQLATIVRKEKPYDVFISFKASDGNKQTEDYKHAYEIYNTLTAEGYRVFFSPVSLREHLGEVYEPYIFAALFSSKVMILVGTKKEYLEAEWVKNEWRRFLFMMRENRDKHILPVYETMKPEDFPQEINKTQAINLSTIGALKLVSGCVKEYMGDRGSVIIIRKKDGKKVNLSNILLRIGFDIENGLHDKAQKGIQEFVSEYGEDYTELRLNRLLANYKATSIEELLRKNKSMENDSDYIYIMEKGNQKIKEQLQIAREEQRKEDKKKEQLNILQSIRKDYENGRFSRVISKIESIRESGDFELNFELEQFYAKAKEHQSAKDKQDEYMSLVGDGTDYLRTRFREKSKEQYEKLCFVEENQMPINKWLLNLGLLILSGGALVFWPMLNDGFVKLVILICVFLFISLSQYYYKEKEMSRLGAYIKGFLICFAISPALIFLLTIVIQWMSPDFILCVQVMKIPAKIFLAKDIEYIDSEIIFLMAAVPLLIGGFVVHIKLFWKRFQTWSQIRSICDELKPQIAQFEEKEEKLLEQEYGDVIDEAQWVKLGKISKI